MATKKKNGITVAEVYVAEIALNSARAIIIAPYQDENSNTKWVKRACGTTKYGFNSAEEALATKFE